MAQSPRFGTDGIRGSAETEVTPLLARALGQAAGEVLGVATAVIGGDTRESTPQLDLALSAGLVASGVEVMRLGVAPTPMVAFIAAQRSAIGFVISASHNPYYDNGIKIFGPAGTKLTKQAESEISERLGQLLSIPSAGSLAGVTAGVTADVAAGVTAGVTADVAADVTADTESRLVDPDAVGQYLAHIQSVLDGRNLHGVHLVIDCANGAASALAAQCFRDLGARVDLINHRPDGRNINAACGATDPTAISEAVVRFGADLGLALDGDADRLIAVDERGHVVDGDHIIALCAKDFKARGVLREDTVVVTVMTNLGFHLAMQADGIAVVQTPVGDRSVLEAMDTGGYNLGGEQSGHVIFREQATTGDGLLTGVMLADLFLRASRGNETKFSELAARAMTSLPQVLINVRLNKVPSSLMTDLAQDLARVQEQLGESGRVLVRASGTEPMVRVMVEAGTPEEASAQASHLAEIIAHRYGG
jgi:phosphoglucosamine mutase